MEVIRIWEGEKGIYKNYRIVEFEGVKLGDHTEVWYNEEEGGLCAVTYRFFAMEDGTIILHRIYWYESGKIKGYIKHFDNLQHVAESYGNDVLKKAGIEQKAPLLSFEEWRNRNNTY